MSRSTRQRARRRRLALAWAISLVSAGVAVLADAAPTGLDVPDAVYRALYGLGVGVACAHSRRWAWPLVAGGALLAGPTHAWAVPAAVALAVATASQLDRRRRQQVGALVGALAAQSLLRLPPVVAWGVPSLVAFLAPLPAVASALVGVRGPAKRPLALAGAVAGGVALVVLVGFGVGLLLVRADARSGVTHARDGIAALRTGDERSASGSFADAAGAFEDAHAVADAWWMAPARVVPVAGQHLDVARSVAEEGRTLAEVSAETAPVVSLADLTSANGRFRLDHMTDLESLAARVVTALEASGGRLDTLSTDWLTSPMAGAVDDLRAEIADSLPDARLAVEALDVAPSLLGADGPRRYVVLFGNPAEARAMGGFVGSIGLLTADRGDLEFESLPNPGELEAAMVASGATLTADVPAPVTSAQPHLYVRNWTASPDIATVNAIVADLLPAATGGTAADGVLYVDPRVVAALLELTGPVTIPETGTELTAGNVVDFLLRDQYLAEDFEPGTERKERLGDAGEAAFERLTSGPLPHPRRLAELLSPVVRARRLLFSTTDPAAHDLLGRVGLRPAIDTGADDTLLVTHANRRPSKMDAYLERTIGYEAEVSDDGEVAATVTVELTNTAPRTGLVPYQTGVPEPDEPGPQPTNHLTLDVHSALDATEVLVDGQPAAFSDLPAYGLDQYSIPVAVPSGATVVVEVNLTGRVDPDRCRFDFVPNAAASADTLRWGIVLPDNDQDVGPRVLDERISAICDSG